MLDEGNRTLDGRKLPGENDVIPPQHKSNIEQSGDLLDMGVIHSRKQ